MSVRPSYGRRKALVSWLLDPSYDDHQVTLYRSMGGTGEWAAVNPDDPVRGSGELEDSGLVVRSLTELPMYRLWLERDGEGLGTDPAGPRVPLRRSEYGTLAKLMHLEYVALSRRGIRAFHLIPRAAGRPCPRVDPETGQHGDHGCADDDCYGTGIIGGYRRPLSTWIDLLGAAAVLKTDSENLTLGVAASKEVTIRLPGWPRPDVNHVLVVPHLDDRYAVQAVREVLAFKGVFPVAFSVTANLLQRNDPAYRLPLPASSWGDPATT